MQVERISICFSIQIPTFEPFILHDFLLPFHNGEERGAALNSQNTMRETHFQTSEVIWITYVRVFVPWGEPEYESGNLAQKLIKRSPFIKLLFVIQTNARMALSDSPKYTVWIISQVFLHFFSIVKFHFTLINVVCFPFILRKKLFICTYSIHLEINRCFKRTSPFIHNSHSFELQWFRSESQCTPCVNRHVV